MPAYERDHSLGEGVYFAAEDYVGVKRRIIIFVIDFVVLIGFMFVLALISVILFEEIPEEESVQIFLCSWLIFVWFYLVVLKASRVRTVGYWVMNARVLSLRGTKPSVLRMTYRLLLNGLFPFNIAYDLLWSIVDEDRQTLTDRFAGTCVIKNQAIPQGKSEIHFAYYCALGFNYAYPCVIRPK